MEFKDYARVKFIKAKPMKLSEYKELQGLEPIKDGNPDKDGYLVMYEDKEPNHPYYDGYITWISKDDFEDSSYEDGKMPLGIAIIAAKGGKRISASHWNGKDMYVFHVSGKCITESINDTYSDPYHYDASHYGYEDGETYPVLDSLALMTPNKDIVLGWLASQTDLLNDTWSISN